MSGRLDSVIVDVGLIKEVDPIILVVMSVGIGMKNPLMMSKNLVVVKNVKIFVPKRMFLDAST